MKLLLNFGGKIISIFQINYTSPLREMGNLKYKQNIP